MNIERRTVVEIVVSVVAVALFVGIVTTIGVTYGGRTLSGEGAKVLVGAILLFVLGMTGVGLFLAYKQP